MSARPRSNSQDIAPSPTSGIQALSTSLVSSSVYLIIIILILNQMGSIETSTIFDRSRNMLPSHFHGKEANFTVSIFIFKMLLNISLQHVKDSSDFPEKRNRSTWQQLQSSLQFLCAVLWSFYDIFLFQKYKASVSHRSHTCNICFPMVSTVKPILTNSLW